MNEFYRWNNTPLDDAISHRNKENPQNNQYNALTKVLDILREHIEEWDARENNDDDIDDSNEANDAIIKHIKEKLHGLSPDIRNFHSYIYWRLYITISYDVIIKSSIICNYISFYRYYLK